MNNHLFLLHEYNEGNCDSGRKERLSNFEMLRVCAMFCIVLGHFLTFGIRCNPAAQGLFVMESASGIADYVFVELAEIVCSTAVNCFILTTGYFMIRRYTYRRGLLNVGLTTIFYSLTLYLAAVAFAGESFCPLRFLRMLSPIPLEGYWFVAKYMGLMLVAPFLSRLVSVLDRQQYTLLLGILLLLFFRYPFDDIFADGTSLQWFCFLYLCGGYINLYGVPAALRRWLVPVTVLTVIGIFLVHTMHNYVVWQSTGELFTLRVTAYNSLTFILSLLIFLLFALWECRGRVVKYISRLGAYMFGVYLLHEHECVRPLLWKHLVPENYQIPVMLHALLVVLAIFLVCTAVEFLRVKIFQMVGLLIKTNKR